MTQVIIPGRVDDKCELELEDKVTRGQHSTVNSGKGNERNLVSFLLSPLLVTVFLVQIKLFHLELDSSFGATSMSRPSRLPSGSQLFLGERSRLVAGQVGAGNREHLGDEDNGWTGGLAPDEVLLQCLRFRRESCEGSSL